MVTTSVSAARAAFEQLCIDTAIGEPGQPAPPRRVAEMHEALRSIATREDRQRRHLDGLQGISLTSLHRRVEQILKEFDHLVADNPDC